MKIQSKQVKKKEFNMTFLWIFKMSFILPNLKLEKFAGRRLARKFAAVSRCTS